MTLKHLFLKKAAKLCHKLIFYLPLQAEFKGRQRFIAQ